MCQPRSETVERAVNYFHHIPTACWRSSESDCWRIKRGIRTYAPFGPHFDHKYCRTNSENMEMPLQMHIKNMTLLTGTDGLASNNGHRNSPSFVQTVVHPFWNISEVSYELYGSSVITILPNRAYFIIDGAARGCWMVIDESTSKRQGDRLPRGSDHYSAHRASAYWLSSSCFMTGIVE